MTTEQNMYASLARIMGDVGSVEKKGEIKSFGSGPSYNFVRDSDVLAKVGPMMADAGIVMVPEHQELLSMDPSMSGKQFIANIKSGWHVTDGKDSLRFETFGQGADSGDKALPKAQSNARKYAFFMLYHIVTGDDPDQHASDQSQDGERASASGGARSQPATTRPAAQRTPEEAALLDELAAVPGMTTARASLLADAVGVPKGQRANADQLRDMLARTIEPPSSETAVAGAEDARASAPVDAAQAESDPTIPPGEPQPESAQALLDAAVQISGGELVPPKPKTPEYDALTAPEKASARAWHQKHTEDEETLAEQLRVPA